MEYRPYFPLLPEIRPFEIALWIVVLLFPVAFAACPRV
jgi:hypothetical protein